MSSLKKPINYKMLESELDDALKADELYKLQNDAKIRAIEQRVPTYDHFRGMVQAAHLRPLERSEMQKKAEVSWNHCHNNKNEDSLKTSDKLNSNESNSNDPNANDTCDDTNINANKEPQTTAEFLKTYKSFPKYEQKFEYLLRFRTSLKDKYFQIEVPPDFLGDFINVGLDICKEDNVSDIINVLQIFKQCNRFSLSITMISPKEKYYLELLFTKILSLGHISSEDLNMEELKSLMVDYDVSFSK